jgi:hypothetical protein
MVVGQSAVDGYLREIGGSSATNAMAQTGGGHDLTPVTLRAMARDAAAILGERYEVELELTRFR